MSSPGPRSQSEPSTVKRAAIQADVLRATEELLEEGASWADLGVEKIATRAGISRTAFYFYFADKRELLMRLAEDVNDELYQQAVGWWSSEGSGDEEAGLRQALTSIAAVDREHAPLLRVIVEVSTYEVATGDFWRGLMGRFMDATRARIESEQAAGRALPGPAEQLAFVLVWASERSLYQAYVNEGADPAAVVDALTTVYLRTVYGRS